MAIDLPKRRRSGFVFLYGILAIVAVAGVMSLVVDFGRVQAARSELQTAADATARHAVLGLSDNTVLSRAQSVAAESRVDGIAVAIETSDVRIGRWDNDTKTFTPSGTPANAVQITLHRSKARGNSIPLVMGSIVGVSEFSLTQQAIAVTNGGQRSHQIVGLDYVNINSNVQTDSYHSASGAYGGANVGQNGSVASNGGIAINGSTIRRDVYQRSGQSLSSNSSTYGTRHTLGTALSFPTPTPTATSSSNNNNLISPAAAGTNVSYNSTTITLPAGHYAFQNLSLNSCTVNITGAVTLNISGNLNVNSTTFNVLSNSPANFAINYVGGTTGSLSFNSVPAIAADIRAPNGNVVLNSVGRFYGRVIGKNLDINSSTRVHVDESLPAYGTPLTGAGGGGAVTLVR